MKQTAVWQLSVSTSVEGADAIAEYLAVVYAQPASSYTDLETGLALVSVFLPRRPDWSSAARARLRLGLARIAECGLNAGPLRISCAKVRRQDWAESWKRHFRPLEIGGRLLILPGWSRRRPRAGQAVVVLDPGLSFGTGQHPTTQFCLEQLAAHRRNGEAQSFLDIGTGSGILAIAAAKLGYSPVEAMDLDSDAVRSARQNARRNHVARQIRVWKGDITQWPRARKARFPVVCANLIANLLLSERDLIASLVEPGGLLVLAGILKEEFGQIRRGYGAVGWQLAKSKTEGEWRSGSFTRR